MPLDDDEKATKVLSTRSCSPAKQSYNIAVRFKALIWLVGLGCC